MTHNLLVSFELRDWLRQGALIVAAIEEFGPVTRILGTCWVVCSDVPAEEVAAGIRQVLGPNDALLVLDLEAHSAVMFNVDERSVQFLRRHWRAADGQAETLIASGTPMPVRDSSGLFGAA
jgi:hypothetical protein